MHIAILDDEAVFRKQIKTVITSQFPTYSISSFSTASELLKCKIDVDLLLLDIDMPDMDGISFSKKYHSQFSKIIFITSYSEFVYDAFGKNIYGFIKKDELHVKLIEKITDVLRSDNDRIIVNTEFGMNSIRLNCILYCFYADDGVHIKTEDEIIPLKYRSLTQFHKELSQSSFLFVDRNTLVNIKNVESVSKVRKTITLGNDEMLKVSRRNWKSLLERYHKEVL